MSLIDTYDNNKYCSRSILNAQAKKRNENTAGDDDEREKKRVETCIIEDAFLFYNNKRTKKR